MMESNQLPLYNGATRKQNVACDACRTKKIRCKRMSIAQRCEQCTAKDLECTSNYIEQLQSKPRRPRRFRSADDKEKRWSGDELGVHVSGAGSSTRVSPHQPIRHVSAPGPGVTPSTSSDTGSASASGSGPGLNDAMAMMSWMPPPNPAVYTRPGPKDSSELQADLLRYLFSPTPVVHHDWRYSDAAAMDQARSKSCDLWEEQGGAVWEETPSAAHLGLWAGGELELERVTQDLIETFFQVVQSRLPILDEAEFKAKYRDPQSGLGGAIPHALLAVVLAFGARFSEHATFLADREEISARENEPGRSRMVQLLVIRAREVVEANKAFRVASLANAQSLMILEGLIGQSVIAPKAYRACYLSMAARHLEHIRDPPMMHMPPLDEKLRTQLAMYMLSNFETAFFRLRPELGLVITDVAPLVSTRSTSSEEDVWLMAARAGAGISAKLSAELWSPKTSASGIPLNVLRDFVHDHSSWRDLYLSKLGLPVPWPEHWSALTTVKTMSTDIYYHGLWLVAEKAMADFGLQESAEESMRGMFSFEVQQVRERLKREALHSATRIAMLSALATEQGYLRVDPLVLYKPIYDAGIYLARQGREDCLGCVAGLRLYAAPYPQMWDLAAEIEGAFLKANVEVASAPLLDGSVAGMGTGGMGTGGLGVGGMMA